MTIGHIATHLALIVKSQIHDTRVVSITCETGIRTGILGIQRIAAISCQISFLRCIGTGQIQIHRSARGAFPPGLSSIQIDMFFGS